MLKAVLLATVVVVALSVSGAVGGFAIGESICADPRYQSYPDFRCADEDAVGALGGGFVGLAAGTAAAIALVRRARRKASRIALMD